MIQLRINAYQEGEADVLVRLLRNAGSDLTKLADCPRQDCQTCRYRHVCDDIGNAVNWLEKKIREGLL